MKAFSFLNLLFFICFCPVFGQKVGLVLSGGGAKAMAHIGVLKALEEEQIPIDYITGTSMGAVIGAFYAAGYSPQQIENIFSSEEFLLLSEGYFLPEQNYTFYRFDDNPSILNLSLNTSKGFKSLIPNKVISAAAFDFFLMKYLFPAEALAKQNFDSLLIPFACVASEINSRSKVVFTKGSLPFSVRASAAYPFYMASVSMGDSLFLDGGIYDNFPVQEMINRFHPDIVLGSNTSFNYEKANEEDILSQLKVLIVNDSDYSLPKHQAGFFLNHQLDQFSAFDFEKSRDIIWLAYAYTKKNMGNIQQIVTKKDTLLSQKRQKFSIQNEALFFDSLSILDLNKKQEDYVRRIFITSKKQNTIAIEKAHLAYAKLNSDTRFSHVFPSAIIDTNGRKTLQLHVKRVDNINFFAGTFLSTYSANILYLGGRYNFFGKRLTTIHVDAQLSKFYTAYALDIRRDFSTRLPFFLNFNFNANTWDYFSLSAVTLLSQGNQAELLLHENQQAFLYIGIPLSRQTLGSFGVNYHFNKAIYSIDNNTLRKNDADYTYITGGKIYYEIEYNTLNKKLFANKGSRFFVAHHYFMGRSFEKENNEQNGQASALNFYNFKGLLEHYPLSSRYIKLGYYTELQLSNQSLLKHYKAQQLLSPYLATTTDLLLTFRNEFRNANYFTFGLTGMFSPFKNMDIRASTFSFFTQNQIVLDSDGISPVKIKPPQFLFPKELGFGENILLSVSTVFHTILGPLAFIGNYYPQLTTNNLNFLITFGYFIPNKRQGNITF
ncbi:MAG: patatin-like phospholipase family protein [Bacteroidota bacterium]